MSNEPTIKFGLKMIGSETPSSALWLFRSYFIISKAIIGYLAAISQVKELHISITLLTVVSLTVTLLLDPIALGVSKMYGVVPAPADDTGALIADKQLTEEGDTKSIKPVLIDSSADTVFNPETKPNAE